MGKIFLVLIVALGAGLYFPQSREAILDAASPLATPAYRWMTNQELRTIVEDLERRVGASEFPTRPGEFDAWLDSRYPQESSRMDAWGTRYQLEVTGFNFRVISAGPDREFGTDDDLVAEGVRSR